MGTTIMGIRKSQQRELGREEYGAEGGALETPGRDSAQTWVEPATQAKPLAALAKKESGILEVKALKDQNAVLSVPPSFMNSQPIGMLVQGFVTEPPTKENPYQFTVRLPNGLPQRMVIGSEAWTGQQGNLGEGPNRLPVELSKGGVDYRANLANTIAGMVGQQVTVRGQMHAHSDNITPTNPHGTLFEVNESVMPGARPGEYRHDDPKYFKQMGVVVAYDHLARLFSGHVDTSGLIPSLLASRR